MAPGQPRVAAAGALTLAAVPLSAVAVTARVPRQLSEISLGDELLGLDHRSGLVVFTMVRAWLHRDLDAELPMVMLRTDAGELITSPFHSIASSQDGSYSFARDFRSGDDVVTASGLAKVRSISHGLGSGLYAPLTLTSNFFVSNAGKGEPSSSFLAHSFAHVPFPRQVAVALHALLGLAERVRPDFNGLADGTRSYVHPVGRAALWFGLPLAPQSWRIDGPAGLPPGAPGRRLYSGGGGRNSQQEQEPAFLVSTFSGGIVLMQPPGRASVGATLAGGSG